MCLCVCVCLRSQFVLLAVDLVAPAARHRWTIGQPTVQARLLAQLSGAMLCYAALCSSMCVLRCEIELLKNLTDLLLQRDMRQHLAIS